MGQLRGGVGGMDLLSHCWYLIATKNVSVKVSGFCVFLFLFFFSKTESHSVVIQAGVQWPDPGYYNTHLPGSSDSPLLAS